MEILSINERVEKVKSDKEAINLLIEEYKPFIASCVKSSTGRYMRYGEDDELSIALIAFVEAINSYNIKAGNFLPFAKNVIKRRLIDYYRKENKQSNNISLNCFNDDENPKELDFSVQESINKFGSEEQNYDRKLEIEELKTDLAKWGITLKDLLNSSPKHTKTRKMYKEIIKYLLENNDLIEIIKQKKCLPTAEIEKRLTIPRKKIERGRRYIIASIIIALGDYQYLKEFLDL
jgi:RNA polymerase sigma factor